MTDTPLLDLVMLVDDDADENFVNTRTLRRSGLTREVIAFENPLEALDYLVDDLSPAVNLIVLDINMPELSGFEFLERHKTLPQAQQAETVIMLLTTSLNPEDVKRAGHYRDTVFQNKPLRPEMVTDALARVGKGRAYK